jgi:hypothetical protein
MPFSCNTCHLSKESIEEIKEHYKADLHVFNSKRRSKNLPPASEEEYCKLASRYVKPISKTNTVAPPKPASTAPQKTAKKTALNTDNAAKISKQVAMAINSNNNMDIEVVDEGAKEDEDVDLDADEAEAEAEQKNKCKKISRWDLVLVYLTTKNLIRSKTVLLTCLVCLASSFLIPSILMIWKDFLST